MKKFLLSLACVSAMAWSASAAEVTFDFSAQGYANAQEVLSIKVNDEISATLTKGSNNNTPKYYTTGNALRLYSGNTFELTSTNGNITKVVFTMGSSNPFNAAATATPGALDVATATWTGDAKTFTITNGSGSGHARVEKMTITYGGTGVTSPPKALSHSLTRHSHRVFPPTGQMSRCQVTNSGIRHHSTTTATQP